MIASSTPAASTGGAPERSHSSLPSRPNSLTCGRLKSPGARYSPRRRVAVDDVDLAHRDVIGMTARDVGQLVIERATRLAPVGPEVEDRDLAGHRPSGTTPVVRHRACRGRSSRRRAATPAVLVGFHRCTCVLSVSAAYSGVSTWPPTTCVYSGTFTANAARQSSLILYVASSAGDDVDAADVAFGRVDDAAPALGALRAALERRAEPPAASCRDADAAPRRPRSDCRPDSRGRSRTATGSSASTHRRSRRRTCRYASSPTIGSNVPVPNCVCSCGSPMSPSTNGSDGATERTVNPSARYREAADARTRRARIAGRRASRRDGGRTGSRSRPLALADRDSGCACRTRETATRRRREPARQAELARQARLVLTMFVHDHRGDAAGHDSHARCVASPGSRARQIERQPPGLDVVVSSPRPGGSDCFNPLNRRRAPSAWAGEDRCGGRRPDRDRTGAVGGAPALACIQCARDGHEASAMRAEQWDQSSRRATSTAAAGARTDMLGQVISGDARAVGDRGRGGDRLIELADVERPAIAGHRPRGGR